jgi:hypothetical protein
MEVVAETTPRFACSGPFVPVDMVRPEVEIPVVLAYGSVDGLVVVATM